MFINVKVSLLILQHLANAPRAQKEAHALAKAGAEVTVLGSWWDEAKSAEDQQLAAKLGFTFVPLIDLRSHKVKSILPRASGKIARELYARSGLILPELYGLTARRMLSMSKFVRPDLTMVHCEPGLWAGCQLLKRGYQVGVDFEDWFSEDLLPEARIHRPVMGIAAIERRLLNEGAVSFATTNAMSERLTEWSECATAPIVVPNCFPWAEAPIKRLQMDSRNQSVLSFYWFSQTIGPGRGLEFLAAALERLEGDWELHLRGRIGGNESWFRKTFRESIRGRVILKEVVPNNQLPSFSSVHDVGLALESPFCPSRNLTATNKIFEYLRCGLAVIATETAGQLEVMNECPQAGWLVRPDDVHGLTKAMQRCIDCPDQVARAKSAALVAASRTWAWERFESRVVDGIGKALSS